ncbi:MAG: Crp/Fnr family transcriptional regulator [Gammaproteobacteria bacterium]|nr:Crp/Fnr family transcriptional regulator [Gammaproteobacteria bacterium]
MECNLLVLDELHHIPLFEALEQSQLEEVLSSSSILNLPARTTLFEKGTPADYFYMLRRGQIKLFCLSAVGDEKVMDILYPKQTFAEAIMFMQKHVYPVSAETIIDSEVFRFDMKVFYNILKESHESCFRLLGIMSRHLHAKVNDINNLTLHNATHRLVIYLLGQLPENAAALSNIHLSTPKNVIASLLSIQPETFSRILLRMSKQNLIEIHGNDISLIDVEGLRALL